MHKGIRLLLFGVALAVVLVGCSSVPTISPREVYDRLGDLGPDLILLDVRTYDEWVTEGHIEGATLIPLDELPLRAANELPQAAEIIVYCRTGNRSLEAAQYLVRKGYTQVYDMGGIDQWIFSGLPVVYGP